MLPSDLQASPAKYKLFCFSESSDKPTLASMPSSIALSEIILLRIVSIRSKYSQWWINLIIATVTVTRKSFILNKTLTYSEYLVVNMCIVLIHLWVIFYYDNSEGRICDDQMCAPSLHSRQPYLSSTCTIKWDLASLSSLFALPCVPTPSPLKLYNLT